MSKVGLPFGFVNWANALVVTSKAIANIQVQDHACFHLAKGIRKARFKDFIIALKENEVNKLVSLETSLGSTNLNDELRHPSL